MQASACWDEGLPSEESVIILRDLALAHTVYGGVHGARIAGLLLAGDYKGVVDYELPLSANWDVLQLINCRAALGFFQKLEDLDVGYDKELVAYEKFRESESKCSKTGAFYRALFRGTAICRPRDVRLLEAIRRKVRRVLGRCPSLSELDIAFGPGATTSIKRTNACPQSKMADGMSCSATLACSVYLPELLREVPHWAAAHAQGYSIDDEGWLVEHHSVSIHDGKLAFVPKNAKTYRSILVEPVLNGLLQMGVGRYIARRLRMRGIDVDIRDQSRNASMAKEGSITGELATLDLRSASDLISTEFVRFILDDDWFRLLNAARTSTYQYNGMSAHLEKFCSMGNGFTFPLETLLFYAITTSVCTDENLVGVYGDDIICPTAKADDVMYALDLCGFEVNTEKSFIQGPFRESCGKDYYLGISCRPYYQKHLVSGQTLFVLHNHYVRLGLEEFAARVLAYIPRSLRKYGPDGYGDGHLISEVYPRYRSPKMQAKGYGGFSFETFTSVTRKSINIFPGDYISPLYHIYSSGVEPVTRNPRSDFWSYREYVESLRYKRELAFSRDGRPFWTTPGKDGYKLHKIYTLGA